MPRSLSSSQHSASHQSINRLDDDEEEVRDYMGAGAPSTAPSSPLYTRRIRSNRSSEVDLHRRVPTWQHLAADERSSLLGHRDGFTGGYASAMSSGAGTPRAMASRLSRVPSVRMNHSRAGSFSMRLVNALGSQRRNAVEAMQDSKYSTMHDDRVWYDQFTSTDWVHDTIMDANRVKELRSRKDIRGRIQAWFDGAQGWILVAIIGFFTAITAYVVNITESALFDLKNGYCESAWYLSERKCCSGATLCDSWNRWSEVITSDHVDEQWVDYLAFVFFVALLAILSCLLTLLSKTVIPSALSLSTLDENLGAEDLRNSSNEEDSKRNSTPEQRATAGGTLPRPPMVYYSAAGSGVAEVRVILSGFVLHGYLGVKTLVLKTLGLILSVASGLSIGKEGPYVHIATCIGNIACRLFSKYNQNDGKRREVLSASAASGVGVAFGAPIGGVLFSLEEVSYFFPPKTLFRTFFCCIVAAISLKFLNPYGTGKIVLFEVRYLSDWKAFEMVAFIFLGVVGGLLGALFIKASRIWARTFRRIPAIKSYPVLEVVIVALLTGFVSFWNRYLNLPVTELLFELASPCDAYTDTGTGLCPTKEQIPVVIWYLCIAFVTKSILTVITFGIKVPAGIYVPSMVVGGLIGRITGHIVQYLALNYAHTGLFGSCDPNDSPESCTVPGVYALVAAGATMCGVTRLSVTLAVILFELTGSLDHVLPFSVGVLVSKWVADALEPLSIYDLLTDMNSYPFLDNNTRPIFSAELGDITPRLREQRVIDISQSPLVFARDLRDKVDYLHTLGEIDGGLPIVRNGILVGLIAAPDLEFALDKLENEDNSLCLMAPQADWDGEDDDDTNREAEDDPTDFTHHIDPAPLSLDVHSPMDLVFECFVKLGLRYVCVLRDGAYAGMVHKKAFVKYVKEVEKNSSNRMDTI